jgi:anti-sigma regulatory factor (Ser/Thr protein kinase)
MTPGPFHCTLPATPASAGEARRFVASALAEAGLPDLADAATLVVSELVANAILHTGTPIDVVVSVHGDHARLEVHDGSAQLPVRKNYSNMSGTGRGIRMVERMAASWGAELTSRGKVVWCEFAPGPNLAFDLLEVEAL